MTSLFKVVKGLFAFAAATVAALLVLAFVVSTFFELGGFQFG